MCGELKILEYKEVSKARRGLSGRYTGIKTRAKSLETLVLVASGSCSNKRTVESQDRLK